MAVKKGWILGLGFWAAVATGGVASGDFHAWAPTPPMGWNSWDCYGSVVDEATVKANADVLAEKFLPFGYDTCVVDIRWTVQNERGADYNQQDPVYTLDAWGRYLPDPKRFPSSAGGKGFKPLADYVHAKGLKFGIHIMRGVPKEAVARRLPVKGADGITCDQISNGKTECCWLRDNCTVLADRAGAQAYYDSILELYAAWGVDFIKCDDLSAPIYHQDEIAMLRTAIDRSGRRIILSTSPGETPLGAAAAAHIRAHANMWRMVNDLWDDWRHLAHLTPIACDWLRQPSIPGAYPDCDMIPLGRLCVKGYCGARQTRLTKDEQIYLMTLFAIARSPLFIGSDLPAIRDDDWTIGLLTNPRVLKVHREGRNIRVVRGDRDGAEITAEDAEGNRYRALFNMKDVSVEVAVAGAFRDGWTGAAVGDSVSVPAHGARLLVAPPAP
ncbi:MAG: alpha-galactosidase [Kiritimatiellia bacterium]